MAVAAASRVGSSHPEITPPSNFHHLRDTTRAGAEILSAMPEVAASTGSACHSGRVELSPVLNAMGVTPQVGMGAIRFSLGRTTTEDDVDHVVTALHRVLG